MRYWISWHQLTKDFRPLTFPPNQAILGWWCSGYTPNNAAILCALVEAADETAAETAIMTDWPEAKKPWRFMTQCEPDWIPGDRFPLKPWMKDRIMSNKHTDPSTEHA